MIQRNYNDKAYTSTQLFGQCFNFHTLINFFIYEVKKPSKFRYRGRICINNINNRDFLCPSGHFFESIHTRDFIFFLIWCCPPPLDTQLPFDILFITMFYTCLVTEVMYHRGGGGAASYKKKLKSLYILSKKCPDGIKISILIFAPTPKTLMVSLLHK